MKEEVKNLWVAALRSGKYKQGKQKLRRGDAFCCLGVLCDISGQGKWVQPEGDLPQRYAVDGDILQSVYPPQTVIDWAGMETRDGRFDSNESGFYDVATANDRDWSFDTIANLIELKWESM